MIQMNMVDVGIRNQYNIVGTGSVLADLRAGVAHIDIITCICVCICCDVKLY